jgi:hypothetical protein
MRPITLVILATICIVIAFARSGSSGSWHRPKATPKGVITKVGKDAVPSNRENSAPGIGFSWWTSPRFGTTAENAKQLLLDDAQQELVSKLRAQHIKWTPSTQYIEQHITQESVEPDKTDVKGTKMTEVKLQVTVSQDDYQEILNADREVRRDNNQLFLARILATIVTICAAVSGYLRLDEATKGYYTNLLRLGSLGLVAVVGGGVWLLA